MVSIESFSNRELTDIRFLYGFCNENALGAQREYSRLFPNRRIPGRLIFETVHRNLAEGGNFRRARGQGRPQGDYDLEEALNIIDDNPQIDLTRVSRITGIPRSINVEAFRSAGQIIPRIIGGQEATPHAYPYQVGIYVTYAGQKDFCGGSLISPNYVLTAAHCAKGALNVTVILGAHDITENEPTQIRITSNNFIVHPQWDPKKLVNDIALIRLPSPIKETYSIKSIKIANGRNTYAGSKGVITGWGKTSNSQSAVTKKLRYVTSEIISNEECKKVDADYGKIVHDSILCVSGKGQVGSCAGDSGGPLTVNGQQVGIVSFGNKDCLAAKPSVFTRLTEYTSWLKSNSDVNL